MLLSRRCSAIARDPGLCLWNLDVLDGLLGPFDETWSSRAGLEQVRGGGGLSYDRQSKLVQSAAYRHSKKTKFQTYIRLFRITNIVGGCLIVE